MAIYAVVRDSQIENVVLWDGENGWTPPEGTVVVKLSDESIPPADTPGIGWDYVDGEFIDNRPVEQFPV
jgi:hypothetical protein